MNITLRDVLRLAGVEPATMDNLEQVGKSLLAQAEGFLKQPERGTEDEPKPGSTPRSPLKSVWKDATDNPRDTIEDFEKNFVSKSEVKEQMVSAETNEKARLIREVMDNLEDLLETKPLNAVKDFREEIKGIFDESDTEWTSLEEEAPVSDDYSWGDPNYYHDYDAPFFQDDSWGR